MQPEGERSRLRSPAGAVLAALALLVVVVVLAALLDFGPFDSSSSRGSQLSKAEFVAKGDAICKDTHGRFVDLQQTPPKTSEEAAALQQQLIDIAVSELNQIRALDAPPEVEPALDRYLGAREQGIVVMKEGLKAAQNNDPLAYEKSKQKLFQGQINRTRLARDVGFTECSSAFPGPAGSGQ